MKAVAITLIVVGGILILAPIVAGYMNEAHRVQLMEKGATAVTLPVPLSSEYTFGCWFTGTAMIAVSVYLAIRSDRRVPNVASRSDLPPNAAFYEGAAVKSPGSES
jgi:hypothetical protein